MPVPVPVPVPVLVALNFALTVAAADIVTLQVEPELVVQPVQLEKV